MSLEKLVQKVYTVRLLNGPKGPTRRPFILAVFGLLFCAAESVSAFGQTLVVGGKNFTEQLLMAEMTAQLLSSKGFQVERRSGYDSTRLRQAQEAGVVDLCWEYTGTSSENSTKSQNSSLRQKPTPE